MNSADIARQLRQEAERLTQAADLIEGLRSGHMQPRAKRMITAEERERRSAAQQARWSKKKTPNKK